MALSDDEKSFYALDVMEKTVHHIGMDGTLLASMGGEGEGPGELQGPVTIQPGAGGGVWVFDNRNQRATHFGPGGTVIKMIAATNTRAGTFSPLEGGEVLIPAGQPVIGSRALLARIGETAVDLEGPQEVPSLLAESGFTERFLGWKLTPMTGNDVAVVLNGPVLRGWRAFIGAGGEKVDSIAELPIPDDVVRTVAAAHESSSLPDARLRPVWRAGMAAGRFWIVSSGLADGPVAFTVPLREGEPSHRLSAASGFHDRSARVRDVIVLPNRIVVAREVEIVILSVR